MTKKISSSSQKKAAHKNSRSRDSRHMSVPLSNQQSTSNQTKQRHQQEVINLEWSPATVPNVELPQQQLNPLQYKHINFTSPSATLPSSFLSTAHTNASSSFTSSSFPVASSSSAFVVSQSSSSTTAEMHR